MALDDESEPEPDVAVVPGSFRDYAAEHPTRPFLVVEVSESSLRFDRHHKGSLYARAGLADYWIVNLVDRVLEVYRDPVQDAATAFGWRYGSAATLGPDASITPLALSGAGIRVVDLSPERSTLQAARNGDSGYDEPGTATSWPFPSAER